MITRLFLCLAYALPMIVGAGEDEEKKDQTLMSCLVKPDMWFTSNEDEGKDNEEGKDRLASKDEDKDNQKFPSFMDDKTNESLV